MSSQGRVALTDGGPRSPAHAALRRRGRRRDRDRSRVTEASLAALIWLVPLAVAFLLASRTAHFTTTQREYLAGAAALVLPGAAAALLAWAPRLRRPRGACTLAASLTGVLVPFFVLVSLSGTRWYFFGPDGDEAFRVEYVTRFADSLRLHDYTYAHTAAFYSPGWFWVTGAAARVAHVAGWVAYKPSAVLAVWGAAVLTYYAWTRSVSPRRAALLAAVTCLALPAAGAAWLGDQTFLGSALYEPYSWVALAPLPALLCAWAKARGGVRPGRIVAVAAAVAAACWLYAEFGALAVAALLTLAVAAEERRARLLEAFLGLVGAAVLVSPWLGPYLLAYARDGFPATTGTTFTNDVSFGAQGFVTVLSPWTLVALFGAFLLVAGGRGAVDRGLRHVGAIAVVAAVAQGVLGSGGRGLLFHRVAFAAALVLLLAGAQGIAELWARHRTTVATWLARRPSGLEAAALSVALVLAGSPQGLEVVTSNLATHAYEAVYPDGSTPGSSRMAFAGSVAQLRVAISSAAGGRPPDQLTVLTDDVPLLVTTPYSGYEQWWELYSSPLGKFRARLASLEDLARVRDPQDMARRLSLLEDAPQVLVLHDHGSTWTFATQLYLPEQNTAPPRTVAFHSSAFAGPCFTTVDVPGYVVVGRRCG